MKDFRWIDCFINIFWIYFLMMESTLYFGGGNSNSNRNSNSNILSYAQECKGEFFTLLADKMPWKEESENCTHSFLVNRDRLFILGQTIQEMNSTLTIYSTLQNLKSCEKMFYKMPNIRIVSIDAKRLLYQFGYTGKVREKMDGWKLTGYVRSSDIVRLLLAYTYNQIYIDSDVYLLDLNLQVYKQPFVAVNVWQDIENALEISNCAFCLPPSILMSMIKFQQNRIVNGKSEYHYTELGPSMFHKVLMNQPVTVALYSQNNPKENDFERIAESIQLYGHKFLHLSTSIRKSYRAGGIYMIINKIRQSANLPPVKRTWSQQ